MLKKNLKKNSHHNFEKCDLDRRLRSDRQSVFWSSSRSWSWSDLRSLFEPSDRELIADRKKKVIRHYNENFVNIFNHLPLKASMPCPVVKLGISTKNKPSIIRTIAITMDFVNIFFMNKYWYSPVNIITDPRNIW